MKKLIEYLKSCGMSEREIARRANVSHTEVNRIVNEERTRPSVDTLRKLAEGLGITEEFILGLAGYLPEVTVTNKANVRDAPKIVFVPIFGRIAAGVALYAEEDIIGYEPVDSGLMRSGTYFCLQIVGDSMINSGITDGSIVLVREQPEVESGEIAAVMVDDENATVKRVYYDGERLILHPDNPKYSPTCVTHEEAKVIGKVVRAIIDPNKRK